MTRRPQEREAERGKRKLLRKVLAVGWRTRRTLKKRKSPKMRKAQGLLGVPCACASGHPVQVLASGGALAGCAPTLTCSCPRQPARASPPLRARLSAKHTKLLPSAFSIRQPSSSRFFCILFPLIFWPLPLPSVRYITVSGGGGRPTPF